MANYPQELAQDAVCQSHTGHMTGLWFLSVRPLRLNTNEWMNEWIRENIKQPYETPGNILIFIFFELQMNIDIPNTSSSPVDEAYCCYIV